MAKNFAKGQSNEPRFYDEGLDKFLQEAEASVKTLKDFTKNYRKISQEGLKSIYMAWYWAPIIQAVGLFRKDGSEVYFDDLSTLAEDIRENKWNSEDEFRIMIYYNGLLSNEKYFRPMI